MSENKMTKIVEESLNNVRDKVKENGQIFAGLAIFGFKTDEEDILDQATVSLSYTEDLPRETQRAMLKIAHKLIGSMLGE
jgi:hypothetical protein